MQCVYPLAAGCAGCESGHAEIYQRGTGTRSGYYTNAEGTGGTSTADVTLDANGAAEIYVNEHVDVKLYDSASTPAFVREFTVMNTDRNTEVISQSFTGQAYAGGGSAASLPVDLQTVLDLWYTSAGALDFEVDLDGAATDIQTAIGASYGGIFNVKAYGAVGDGVTDDRAAILAAQTAADAYGGVVYIPVGTYQIDSAIDWQDTCMVGVPDKSVIQGSNVTFSSADDERFFVAGISFLDMTVEVEEDDGDVDMTFVRCRFERAGDTTNCFLIGTDSTNPVFVHCIECGFYTDSSDPGGNTPHISNISQTQGYLMLTRCWLDGGDLIGTGATDAMYVFARARLRDCYLDISNTTNGSLYGIGTNTSDADVEITGLRVSEKAGSALAAVFTANTSPSTGYRFIERDTVLLGTNYTAVYDGLGSDLITEDVNIIWGSREGKRHYESGTIAGTDALAEQLTHEFIWYNKTDTGNLTIDLDANNPPPGSRTFIVVVNASGGTPTLDLSGTDVSNHTSHAMTAGRKTYYYVSYHGRNGVVVNAIEDVA